MPALITNVLVPAGITLFSLVIIGIILTRLYRRSTKDVALIRTGFGGEKVVLNGGVMVIPVLHELMQVRLTTVKLEVSRLNKDALITLDKLRVDVVGLFHIKVKPDAQSIGRALVSLSEAARWAAGFGVRLGLEFRDNSMRLPVEKNRVGYRLYAGSLMWDWQVTPRVSLTSAVRVDHLALNHSGPLLMPGAGRTPPSALYAADHHALGPPRPRSRRCSMTI